MIYELPQDKSERRQWPPLALLVLKVKLQQGISVSKQKPACSLICLLLNRKRINNEMYYPAKYNAMANEMTEMTNTLIAIRLLGLDISG